MAQQGYDSGRNGDEDGGYGGYSEEDYGNYQGTQDPGGSNYGSEYNADNYGRI